MRPPFKHNIAHGMPNTVSGCYATASSGCGSSASVLRCQRGTENLAAFARPRTKSRPGTTQICSAVANTARARRADRQTEREEDAAMNTLTKVALGFVGQLKPDRAKGRTTERRMLPRPTTTGGLPLLEALARRRSSRAFSPAPLPDQVLSDCVGGVRHQPAGKRRSHCAFGPGRTGSRRLRRARRRRVPVRRQGARPGPRGARGRAARHWLSGFCRRGAAGSALRRRPQAHGDGAQAQRDVYSAASAGAIAQNVYLYCASAGLLTVLRGLAGPRGHRKGSACPSTNTCSWRRPSGIRRIDGWPVGWRAKCRIAAFFNSQPPLLCSCGSNASGSSHPDPSAQASRGQPGCRPLRQGAFAAYG